MKLNKIRNKIQSEEYCNEIIQKYNLSRQGFYDLSYIQKRTLSNTNLWYAYKKQYKINFIDLQNYSQTGNFITLDKVKSKLKNKFQYWKNYLEEITSIEVDIIIQEIMELELLGQFFLQQDYERKYVCAIKTKEEYFFKLFNENTFLTYLYHNKLQTVKENNKKIHLNINEIEQFINK